MLTHKHPIECGIMINWKTWRKLGTMLYNESRGHSAGQDDGTEKKDQKDKFPGQILLIELHSDNIGGEEASHHPTISAQGGVSWDLSFQTFKQNMENLSPF